MLPGIPAEYLETKLEKIRRSVEEAVIPGYAHLRPSISIGGVMQTITDPIERAVRQADRMMYQAKNRKNTVAVAGPDRENVKNGTQEAPQQARQQILIIDDSEMNCAILAAILRQDYRILEAANGEEGVEMINQHGGDIALVLLDLIMPVMDGFDVLDYMTRNLYHRGHAGHHDLQRGLGGFHPPCL